MSILKINILYLLQIENIEYVAGQKASKVVGFILNIQILNFRM